MSQIEADHYQPAKVLSHSCHNCNSSNGLTIQRCRIDDTNSIQSWSCNNCGFKWQEIWSSYGQPLWSEQFYHSK